MLAKALVAALLAASCAQSASVGGRHSDEDGTPAERGPGDAHDFDEDDLGAYDGVHDYGADETGRMPPSPGQGCAGGVCEVLSDFQKEYGSLLKEETYEPSVLMVGIVADSARTVGLWNAARELAASQGTQVEYIAYSTYERLVMAAFHGHFQLGWYSPLAMVEIRRMARAYGFKPEIVAADAPESEWDRSVCVTPAGSAVNSPKDLAGKTVAVGSADSHKSAMLPLHHLAKQSGLKLGEDIKVLRHDHDLGRHGLGVAMADQRAAAAALAAGEADAACFGERDLAALQKEGLLAGARVVTTTEPAAGFGLAVLDGHEQAVASLVSGFRHSVLNMTDEAAASPEGRAFLEAAGGRNFVPPAEVDGYEELEAAVGELKYLERWLESLGATGDLSGEHGEHPGDAPFPEGMNFDDEPHTFGDMNFDDMSDEERQAFFGTLGEFDDLDDTPPPPTVEVEEH